MSKKTYNPREDERIYIYAKTFEAVQEVTTLQGEGLISRLQYRWDRNSGEYVVRFEGHPNVEFSDYPLWFTLNYDVDYYPDAYEERRKWENNFYEKRQKWENVLIPVLPHPDQTRLDAFLDVF